MEFDELSQYVQEIVLLSYVLREDLALFVTLLFLSRGGLEVLDLVFARGGGLRPIINQNVQPLRVRLVTRLRLLNDLIIL